MRHQRLELRAENEFARFEEGVVQRFHPEAVAHHEQRLLVAVPQCKGKHAAKARHTGFAPGFPGVDDDFGIGMGAEGVAQGFELGHEFLKVGDFAVEHDDDRAILIEQRLLAGGQVDDRQPPVAQSHARFQMQAAFVGAAMELRFVHAMEQRAWNLARFTGIENAGNAAHGMSQVPVEFSRESAAFQRLRAR